MAARVYSSASQIAEVSKSTTGYTDAGSCALTHTPNDNTDVLYIWSARVSIDSVANDVQIRLYHDTASTELAVVNYEAQESSGPTDYRSVGGVCVVSYGSSPGSQTISLEYAAETGGSVATVKDARIVAIQLTSNDKFSTGTATADSSTSTTDADVSSSSVTFTPGSSGDYLILWSGEGSFSATNAYARMRLTVDGADEYRIQQSVQDATNYVCFSGAEKVTLDATSHTLKLRFSGSNTGTSNARRGRVVALRLSDFDASYFSEDRTGSSGGGTSYTDVLTYNPTISNAVDHLVIGAWVKSSNSTSVSAYTQFTDGTVTIEDVNEANFSGDNWPGLIAYVADVPSGSGTTYKTSRKAEGSVTVGCKENAIAILQLEASSGETVTITKVAMTVSGQAVTGNARTTLAVTKAALTMTGQAVVGNAREILSVANAAMTLTGQAFVANARTVASIAAGALTLTGQAVVGNARTVLAVAAGTLTLTGQAVAATTDTVVTVTKAALALTGQAIVTNARENLSIAAGSIALAGQNVLGNARHSIEIAAGSLALTGQAIVTNARTRLETAAGSITLTGHAVTTNAREILSVAAGSIALTGQAVVSNASEILSIAAGSISYAGQAVTTRISEIIQIGAATITLTGQAVATVTGPIPPAIRRILGYPVALTAQIWAPLRADTGRPSTTS